MSFSCLEWCLWICKNCSGFYSFALRKPEHYSPFVRLHHLTCFLIVCFLKINNINTILSMPHNGSLLPKICKDRTSCGTKAFLGRKIKILNCVKKFGISKILTAPKTFQQNLLTILKRNSALKDSLWHQSCSLLLSFLASRWVKIVLFSK